MSICVLLLMIDKSVRDTERMKKRLLSTLSVRDRGLGLDTMHNVLLVLDHLVLITSLV